MDTTRSLVCAPCDREGFAGDVCPCYSAAIAEDTRTTWSKIDDPRYRRERDPEIITEAELRLLDGNR